MLESYSVKDFVEPPHPKGLVLQGVDVRLEPLDADRHAGDLFAANTEDQTGQNWAYLPYGPFDTFGDYQEWLREQEGKTDPVFFAIIRLSDAKAVGLASYLRINQTDGVIEVGHIHFSPQLQRTKAATEAMVLMMSWALDSGYRRYEWKCNALNKKSRRAAQRLGFSFEGIFRQAAIVKGQNRDTAWFAVIDKEWPELKECFKVYLSDENFDADGLPRTSLSALTRPLLYKIDPIDIS